MKTKLTQVNRYTTKKDGTALVASNGRPYTSIRIKTVEHGDKVLSGFGNQDNSGWREGDEVEINVEQKGEYLNFSTPKKEDKANESFEKVLNILVGIRVDLAIIKAAVAPMQKAHVVEDSAYPQDMNPDDIPF